jgi:putative hemolysin
MTKKIIVPLLILILLICSFLLIKTLKPVPEVLDTTGTKTTGTGQITTTTGMANPASVYCKDQGEKMRKVMNMVFVFLTTGLSVMNGNFLEKNAQRVCR